MSERQTQRGADIDPRLGSQPGPRTSIVVVGCEDPSVVVGAVAASEVVDGEWVIPVRAAAADRFAAASLPANVRTIVVEEGALPDEIRRLGALAASGDVIRLVDGSRLTDGREAPADWRSVLIALGAGPA